MEIAQKPRNHAKSEWNVRVAGCLNSALIRIVLQITASGPSPDDKFVGGPNESESFYLIYEIHRP